MLKTNFLKSLFHSGINRVLLFTVFFILLAEICFGQKPEVSPEKANPVKIPKIEIPPIIDGKLDEEIWKTAAVLKDFYQTSPGNNIPPSKQTEAYAMYDEKNFYIGFRCWDEPDKIRATVAKRDVLVDDDTARIWLDTFNDRRRAYVFWFNPLGIQQDGIYTEGQGADYSVDIVMESKGLIEDWGWSVEVKIPFKSLRFAAGKGKMWGFMAGRKIARLNNEVDLWLPVDRNVSGFLVEHGKITGLDEIKTERTLEVVPSVTLSETGRRVEASEVPQGRFINQPVKQDLGVNLKYTITPNITLDAAINPDFAEIEADAPVITANQRFPIFFQEKRPFFLEGKEIFETPVRIFHSRTIVDPDVAIKLSGKIGRNSFGFLASSDKAPGNFEESERNDPNIRPKIDQFLDKTALFGVLRLKRDFGANNNAGFLAAYRGFPEQKNLAGGFDGRFKFTPKLTSQFQVVGTHSRRCFFDAEFEPILNPVQAQRNREICGGGSFGGVTVFGSSFNQYRTGNGLGYYAILDYAADTRGWSVEFSGRSKDYRADSGFTTRTNTNSAFFTNRFSTKSAPKSKIIRVNWNQFTKFDYDWKSRLQNFRAGTNIELLLQRNTTIFVETGTGYERLYEEEFGLKRSFTRSGAFLGLPTRAAWQPYFLASINQNVSKKFNYGTSFSYDTDIFDFDFNNSPQNPGTGKQFTLRVNFEYKPIDPFRVSLNFQKSQLTRHDTGQKVLDVNLFTLRSTYQFSRFTFVRLRTDYDTSRRNLSRQLLFGWNPNPGTAVYVGYNDNLNYKGFNPFTGQPEQGFERNSRTFFIRMSYLFRKSF